MIQIKKYIAAEKQNWDLFNAHAKNSTFLFYRDYLEYHAERFKDQSLLFYHKGKLLGLLPLHWQGDTVSSHNGLTFGGIICGFRMKTPLMAEIFVALLDYLNKENFKRFIYKPVPVIYHQVPAQEDLYALYLNKATLQHRTISSALVLNKPKNYSELRLRLLKKVMKSAFRIEESNKYTEFMQIVAEVLWHKHGIWPAHTATEISYLASKFSRNIKLYVVYSQEEMLGGTLVYLNSEVVHLQYIAFNQKGKQLHALDLVVDFLIKKYQVEKTYLNFGVSHGQDIYDLNLGLIFNKESYGAGPIIQDTYLINL